MLVLGGAGCGRPDQAKAGTTLRPGAVVPASTAAFERTLRSMRGRPVVVNYWASWCIPCRSEMPRLVRAAERYDRDVRFLGVDVEDDQAAAEAFAKRFDIPFPSMADPKSAIRHDRGILGLPVTQFFRADGKLGFVHNGEIQSSDLRDNIEQLLMAGKASSDD